MANKEKEEVKKKSTLVHDTICLFMITLISGLLLGAGYTITKKPKSSDKEFNGQFVGTNASQDLNVVKDGSGSTKDGTINAITSATITSKAVTRAIDGAFQFISSLE